MTKTLMVAIAATSVVSAAHAQVRITEWMYSGEGPEFVEFTNLGSTAVDFAGWSYDDDSRTAGVLDLSAFGIVAAGETVLITEGDADQFRTSWSLASSVKIIDGYTNNLGRNDEINLFDAAGNLVDRLTYGDGDFPGTIRTQERSGNPLAGALGANDPSLWVLSSVGDSFGSYVSVDGDVGNPGIFIPAPGAAGLLGLAGLMAARRRRA